MSHLSITWLIWRIHVDIIKWVKKKVQRERFDLTLIYFLYSLIHGTCDPFWIYPSSDFLIWGRVASFANKTVPKFSDYQCQKIDLWSKFIFSPLWNLWEFLKLRFLEIFWLPVSKIYHFTTVKFLKILDFLNRVFWYRKNVFYLHPRIGKNGSNKQLT